MKLTVLWTNKKNGNGICIDKQGNEYYIDSSIACFCLLKRHDVIVAKTDRLMPDNILVVKDIDAIYHGLGKVS